jgi:hypothetical protein
MAENSDISLGTFKIQINKEYVNSFDQKMEEQYWFYYTITGEINSVRRKVKVDKNGNGRTTTTMQGKTGIDVEDVPSDVREQVNEMLSNAVTQQ